MKKRSIVFARVLMLAALGFGGSSLILFAVFLFRGPYRLIEFGGPTAMALGFDMGLCLLFFVQHSLMVRTSFQEKLSGFVPLWSHRALYAIASGAVLLALLAFWQPTSIIFSVQGTGRWVLRGLFFAGLLGFVWGVKALGSFDGFGIRPIKARLGNREPRDPKFAARGPYTFVRHPLYSFALILLWSFPDISLDRLLLNISWSIWVVIGTLLEERDLVLEFGPIYTEYQKTVPMLVPWRVPGGGR